MNNNLSSLAISKNAAMIMVKAYLWMFVATLITFITGLLFTKVINNSGGYLLFLSIFSFIALLILGYKINKSALVLLNYKKALLFFILYSLITGFTFSSIFIFFDVEVLFNVFASITLYFLLLTLLTLLFKKKIHNAKNLAYTGLLTLLIASILVSLYTIFFYNPTSLVSKTLHLSISILGILIFSIITMVDIKTMYTLIDENPYANSLSIYAAFALYLDFINIFLYILRILLVLGKNTRNRN